MILCAGAALEFRVMTIRAHRLWTGVLSQFPTRIGAFQGADAQNLYAERVRKIYWPATVVYRDYAGGADEPIQVLIAPDNAGTHTQDICTRYSGWKILQQTSGVLRGVPVVHLTRTVEASPQIPGEDPGFMACAQYWRDQKRGLSEEESDSLVFWHGFCFRVLMCTGIKSLAEADCGFAKIDAFAAAADPVVCQFLQKAGAE
jgi:hypothetical protein